jgi:hypothetical protein
MAPKSGEVPFEDKDLSTKDISLSANETEEIWSSILQGVASSKIVPTKNLLVLGSFLFKVLHRKVFNILASSSFFNIAV